MVFIIPTSTFSWYDSLVVCLFIYLFIYFSIQDTIYLAGLVSLSGEIVENIDFSVPGFFAMATTGAGKSPNTTPTKWSKKLPRPMGNLTSVVRLLAKLVMACSDLNQSNVSSVLFCDIWTVW